MMNGSRSDMEPLLAFYAGEAKLGQLNEDQVRQLLDLVENDMVQSEGVLEFAPLLQAWLMRIEDGGSE